MRGALVTLKLALSAAGIGMAFGTLMGIASSKRLAHPFMKYLIKAYVIAIQGTPVFIQVLLFYYALPSLIGLNLSPFAAGAIALGLNSTAYITEIIRGGINAVPAGQWEASYSLGYSSTSTLISIILPQSLKIVLPSLTNEVSVLIKETAVISIIGVLELTKVGMNLNSHTLDPVMIYGTIALIYLFMTSVITGFSNHYLNKETHHD